MVDSSKASTPSYALLFDTANEVVAVAFVKLNPADLSVTLVASFEEEAHRASNTRLLPDIDKLMEKSGIARSEISCVAVGRGPGSFTGVRIAMACAKGIASSLGVALIGLSTLDAIAQGARLAGVRGRLCVVADAMRREIYPVYYNVSESYITRLNADCVKKASQAAEEACSLAVDTELNITGDALTKYIDLFGFADSVLPKNLWYVTGEGLAAAFEAEWKQHNIDPFDSKRHNPGYILPVYTRLSDAEENERERLARTETKDLTTGVQGGSSSCEVAQTCAIKNKSNIVYKPLDGVRAEEVARLESNFMGAGAWTSSMILDDLANRNHSWWAALAPLTTDVDPAELSDEDYALIGYASGLIVDGELQILRVCVDDSWRRLGIAQELLNRVSSDGRNLGANNVSLEVRVDNKPAVELYKKLGFSESGVRPRYYSDGSDALIMTGEIVSDNRDVAGMDLLHHDEVQVEVPSLIHPLILAIESSCDETAAAIIDGNGHLLSDVVASQIDFHARFGGVVPEIASRKHIEAICGVCDEAIEVAAANSGNPQLSWSDLDSVAVTYAPGLLGALVVGVSFAKGAAWAQDIPFIGVNHLEGHLYANKIGEPNLEMPLVASLVSGGNTMLVEVKDWGKYNILGTTIDDAVGEAFDKVAKALDLGYPGGPIISRYAKRGDAKSIPFPRAMMHSHDFRFSLSGLKTAVVTYIDKEKSAGRALNIPNIAASFQQAVIDVQVAKARTALDLTGAKTFCLGGGVAANPALRDAYEQMCKKKNVHLVMPPLRSCGDNAGMIALVALDRYKQEKLFALDADAKARADLSEPY